MLPLTPCSTCGPLPNSTDDGRTPCRWEYIEWGDGSVQLWEFCLVCGHMNS